MFSYRLGMVNDFHWGFKPVFSYSKPHLNKFTRSNKSNKNIKKPTEK